MPEVLPQVRHAKPGFFLNFPNQRHIERFTRLYFTAGQLENTAHEIILGPLEQQHLVVMLNHCTDNELPHLVALGFGKELFEE